MSTYEQLKNYYAQKGYEGFALERQAAKVEKQIEAVEAGAYPVQPTHVPAAVDAWTNTKQFIKN